MGNDFRLLVDFLFHEMAVIALVDDIGGRGRNLLRALYGVAVEVHDFDAILAQDRPVASCR